MSVAHPVLLGELLEPQQRSLGRVDARLRQLARLVLAVVLEAEEPDHGRQRQALDDERAEDDGEREEEDQVAAGEGSPASV